MRKILFNLKYKKNKFAFASALVFACGLFLLVAPGKVSAASGWTNITSTGDRVWQGLASSSDGTKLAGAVYGGYIYTSSDSGVTWTARTGPGTQNWRFVTSSSDGTKLLAGVEGGYLYTSADSGANWTQRTSVGVAYWYGGASSSDGTKLIAVSRNGYIYTSANSGVAWTARTSAGIRDWRAAASSSDGTILVAAVDGGYIYTSADSGANWTERTSAGSRYWYSAASSADGTKLFVSGVNGAYIFGSTDSGITWSQKTTSNSPWVSIASSSDGTKLVAGMDGGYVFTSDDAGANWTQQTSAGNRYWRSVTTSSDGSKLVAGNVDYIWTYGEVSPSTSLNLFLPRIDCCSGYFTNRGTISADFNNDGKKDIAKSGSIMLGNGDGTFQTLVSQDFGSYFHIVAADFNNDGKKDIAATDYGSPGHVYISLGNGNGTFQAKVGYSAIDYPDFIAATDFNNDGKSDLVTTNYYGNQLSVYLGNGDGTFQAKVDYASGGNAIRQITTADFNNDGKTDIAVASPYSSNNVSILIGNGDGTFQTKVDYPAGIGATAITSGDFNNDGKTDLAVGNGGYYSSGNMSVLLGNGDGTFQTKVDYAAGANPRSIINQDINGDGYLDLLVTNYHSANFSVYLGNGDGTFQTKFDLSVDPSTYPDTIISDDFNNDTLPDLLVSDGGYVRNFSVFLHSKIVLTYTGSNLNVAEGGATDTYSAVLAKQPTSNVTVTITPNSQLTADKATLTFTSGNWNIPQVVTVSAVDDGTYQGTRTKTIVNSLSSADSLFNNATGSVDVSITDNDFTALISKSRVHVSEGGSNTTYTVRLATQPSANVTITPNYDPSLTVTPASLTFSTANWNTPQTITVSAANDSNIEGTRTPSITHTVSSADTNYDGLTISGVDVVITDSTQTNLFLPNKVSTLTANNSFYRSVATDFNGDGKQDLAITSYSGGNVSILLGNGDGTFQAKVDYATGNNPYGITSEDFNGDGKKDLAVVNMSSPTISILLGNGDGTFQTKVDYVATPNSIEVTTSDFNGDGKKDLAVASQNGNSVSVFRGNGDGTFQTKVDYATGSNPIYVIAEDFNADGLPDLVTTNYYNTTISVLLGNGDGTFQAKVDYATASGSRQIFSADFNGDGKKDLLIGNLDSTVSILFGNGDGTFQTKVDYVVSGNAYSVTSTDLNADGLPDIAIANSSGSTISVLFGNGDGTFQAKVDYAVGGTYAQSINTADFNGDGLPDIVTTMYGTSNLSIMLSSPVTFYQLTSTLSVAEGGATDTYAVALAKQPTSDVTVTITPNSQLTTDNQTLTFTSANWNTPQVVTVTAVDDAIYQGSRTRTINNTVSSSDLVYDGATGSISVDITDNDFTAVVSKSRVHVSEGGSSVSYTVRLVTQPTDDVVITLNHDPSITLSPETLTFTSANWNTPQTVTVSADDDSVIEGTRTQTITHASSSADPNYDGITIPSLDVFITDAIQTNIFLPKIDSSLDPYQNFSSSVSADFNGDGKQDLATAENNLNKISILLGNGDGTFQTKVDYAAGSNPNSITAGDFNNDGNQDLATANNGDNTTSILLGNGDGTFQTKVDYATGASPYSIVAADFNTDGNTDISTSNLGANTVSVLLGNGDGTFETKVDYPVGSYPFAIAATDFNGDGNPDIVASCYYNFAAYVLLGNGDGTFQNAVSYATGSYPRAITTDDFNGDGNQDFATVNSSYPYTASVLLGNGDGTFQTKVDYPTSYSSMILSTDFNGDGVADLVIKSNDNNKIGVLFGNGDGTFQAQTDYITGGNPQSLTSGDYNNDGLADLAVTSSDFNNLSILLGSPLTFYQTAVPLSVSESGTNDSYAVALAKQPSSDVTVTVTPNSQLTTDKSSLTFTTGNWNTPQVVTVSAVDNSTVEGTRSKFVTHIATSSDPIFNNINLSDGIEVNILDDDLGVVITSDPALDITEGYNSGSYQVKLSTEPTDDVTVTIIPADPLVANTPTLTFTSANWNTYQYMYVTAPDDDIFAGTRVRTISHTSSSSDSNYNNLTIPNVTVNIHDAEGYLASDVIGQLDGDGNPVFTTSDYNNNESNTNPRGLDYPEGAAIDSVDHRLFVVDEDNNRVLIFNLDTNNNLVDHTADYVLGEPDFETSNCETSQTGLCYPYGDAAYDPVRQLLFVSDYDNSRIVVYDVRPENSPDRTMCGTTTNGIVNGMPASCVLGQAEFDSYDANTSQTLLYYPYGVTYDSTRQLLFVADYDSSRVVVYDVRDENSSDQTMCGTTTNGIANGMNASCVLGQVDFDSSDSNTSQTGLSYPYSVTYDPERQLLFVDDNSNYRVLVYDVRNDNSPDETFCGTTTNGIANGMPASCVIGQVDFDSSNSDTTRTSLYDPEGVAYDPSTKQLYVVDYDNYRVMIFDMTTLSNNPEAAAVLGQPNFTTSFSGTSRSRINSPEFATFDSSNNRLYLSDTYNDRILIYDFVKIINTTLPSALVGAVYNQTITTENSQGTVTFAITEGSLPAGLTLDSSTGVISGTPTATGDYNFEVMASDSMSFGTFKSQPKNYSITVTAPSGGGGGPAPGSPPAAIPPVTLIPPPVILPPNPEEPTPPTQTPPTDGEQNSDQDSSITLTIPQNVLSTFFVIPKTLSAGTQGQNIKTLQQILNELGFSVSTTGAGSPGHETTYFGPLTKKALIRFQEAHSEEILKPLGLKHGTGILGPYTLKFLKSLLGY